MAFTIVHFIPMWISCRSTTLFWYFFFTFINLLVYFLNYLGGKNFCGRAIALENESKINVTYVCKISKLRLVLRLVQQSERLYVILFWRRLIVHFIHISSLQRIQISLLVWHTSKNSQYFWTSYVRELTMLNISLFFFIQMSPSLPLVPWSRSSQTKMENIVISPFFCRNQKKDALNVK